MVKAAGVVEKSCSSRIGEMETGYQSILRKIYNAFRSKGEVRNRMDNFVFDRYYYKVFCVTTGPLIIFADFTPHFLLKLASFFSAQCLDSSYSVAWASLQISPNDVVQYAVTSTNVLYPVDRM